MRYERIHINDAMRRELLPGETALWAGQPDPAKLLELWDFFLIPFSVFWTAFAVMWTIMALATGPRFFAVVGIPFLVMGTYITVGRFFVKTNQKKYIYYAVTDKRVLIMRTFRDGRRKSLISRELDKISMEKHSVDRKGRGTIIFGRVPMGYSAYLNTGLSFFRPNDIAAFCDIEDCDRVMKLYREAKMELKNR